MFSNSINQWKSLAVSKGDNLLLLISLHAENSLEKFQAMKYSGSLMAPQTTFDLALGITGPLFPKHQR